MQSYKVWCTFVHSTRYEVREVRCTMYMYDVPCTQYLYHACIYTCMRVRSWYDVHSSPTCTQQIRVLCTYIVHRTQYLHYVHSTMYIVLVHVIPRVDQRARASSSQLLYVIESCNLHQSYLPTMYKVQGKIMVRCTQYIVRMCRLLAVALLCTVYYAHVCTDVHRTMYLYIVRVALPCTLYKVRCTMYDVLCTMYKVRCTLYLYEVHVRCTYVHRSLREYIECEEALGGEWYIV